MIRVSGSHATFGRVVRVQLPFESIDLVFEPPMFGLLLAGLALVIFSCESDYSYRDLIADRVDIHDDVLSRHQQR